MPHQKSCCGLALLAVLFFIVPTGRAAESSATRTRIGVVYVQEVFDKYKYAKDQEASVRVSFEKEEAAITIMTGEIKKLREDLSADSSIVPGSALHKMKLIGIQKEILKRRLKQEKYQKRLRNTMADFYRKIYADFRQAVKQIAVARGYDLVITAPNAELSKELIGAAASPTAIKNEIILRRVQYTNRSVDITAAVLHQMNANYSSRKTLQNP